MLKANEEFKEATLKQVQQKEENYNKRMAERKWITIGSMDKHTEQLTNNLLRRNLYHSQSRVIDYFSNFDGSDLCVTCCRPRQKRNSSPAVNRSNQRLR